MRNTWVQLLLSRKGVSLLRLGNGCERQKGAVGSDLVGPGGRAKKERQGKKVVNEGCWSFLAFKKGSVRKAGR